MVNGKPPAIFLGRVAADEATPTLVLEDGVIVLQRQVEVTLE
jgi:hypothetical protein